MTYPHLEPVNSTSIEAVGYVEDAHELHVQFVSGGYYVYESVPPATYQELISADSLGEWCFSVLVPRVRGLLVRECCDRHLYRW